MQVEVLERISPKDADVILKLGLTQCWKRDKKEEELGKAKWQRNLAS